MPSGAKPAPRARFVGYFGNADLRQFPAKLLQIPLQAAATSPSASATSEGRDLSDSASNPARIPILYVILGVLLVISIVPMYFYSTRVEAINRDRLKTNERLLQNTNALNA